MNSPYSLDQIKIAIDEALESSDHQPIAAFDADGTLWEDDMGEKFFLYQSEKKLLPNLPEDPWQHYLDMHDTEPVKAFLWLAQVNAGQKLQTVREWGDQCVKDLPPSIFNFQKEIIAHLHSRDVEVYVVTASAKWAVEPAAKLYNIPVDRVIGFQTKIIDGMITEDQVGASTWREGKVDGLLEATGGKKPFFCSGNTMGDYELVKSATALRLTLRSADETNVNYETEQELLKHAKDNGWFWYSKFEEDFR